MFFTFFVEKNRLHAEDLAKSTKTISQIETGIDGTSKKTDIEFMNFLELVLMSYTKTL